MSFQPRFSAVLLALTALIGGCAGEPAAPPCEAPAARPNFLVIIADDMGFSDAGCYGGEIRTPNLDRLAANGLRFTQFYNTGRCWPTRSCLLTGYFPQQIRMDPPQPGRPAWMRVLPHYLKPAGYRCYHSGKWHLFNAPRQVADAGFDHSYSLEDTDRFFSPEHHTADDLPLPQPARESGYYATTAIADRAIDFLKQHAVETPTQPFCCYVAFIAPHFPLHALPEDIARYRDRYHEGWDAIRQQRWQRLREMGIVNCQPAARDDKLHPRYFQPDFFEKVGPGEIDHAVAWTALTDEQRRFQATKMALHAAMVDRMDQQIGRLVAQLRAMQAYENTVIFFLSDNGADATLMVRGDGHDRAAEPGSAASFLCLGPGWASASNSPFRRHKVWVHEGGVSTPLVVQWPRGIAARGELRHTVGHVVDLLPTLLDLAGVWPPAPQPDLAAPPQPGRSLVPVLAADDASAQAQVYLHHEGNRGLRLGNWKLVSAREDHDVWELFDLSTDRSEQVNLAEHFPERVRAMEAQWKALDAQFQRDAELPPKQPAARRSP